MKLLLDTHVILWAAAEPGRLSSETIERLESGENELWFSPISVWETIILAEKGRIVLEGDIEQSVRRLFQTLPLKEAAVNLEVAVESRRVPLLHHDPADRFIAATATVYDLVLVTADRRLLSAGDDLRVLRA